LPWWQLHALLETISNSTTGGGNWVILCARPVRGVAENVLLHLVRFIGL
jgi:hypothetical protein